MGNTLGYGPHRPTMGSRMSTNRLGGAGIDNPVNTCLTAPVSSWLSALSAPPGLRPPAVPPDIASAISILALRAPSLGHSLTPLLNGDPRQIKSHPLYPDGVSSLSGLMKFLLLLPPPLIHQLQTT